MKKIKLTDILLLSVAGFFDLFQEMKDPGGIYSNYYQNFYGFVPNRWKKGNYSSLVSRMIQDKKIRKIKKNNKLRYEITTKGITHLQNKYFVLSYQKKRWDKKWRVMIFDIEETNRKIRDSLRYKIKQLGFGYLQKSVWVSPYNTFSYLKQFIKDNNLDSQIILIESQKLSIKNEELARIIWPIDKIKLSYIEIYQKLVLINKKIDDNTISSSSKVNFGRIYKNLISTILRDPHLPKEFLPKDWPYNKTINLAKKIKHIL